MEHNSTHQPEQHSESIKDAVLTRITRGDVPMRPRSYFLIRIMALVALVLAIFLVTILIANFILFSIRINSHDELLHFGYRGFTLFIKFFPWPLLVLDVILIAIAQRLLSYFRFGYRYSMLFFFGLFALIVAGVGFAIDRGTGINDSLLHHDDRHQLPFGIDGFYRGVRLPPPPDSGICRCRITAISGNVLSSIDVDTRHGHAGTARTIIVNPAEPLLATLHVGNIVFALGNMAPGTTTINAAGIRVLPSGVDEPPQE